MHYHCWSSRCAFNSWSPVTTWPHKVCHLTWQHWLQLRQLPLRFSNRAAPTRYRNSQRLVPSALHQLRITVRPRLQLATQITNSRQAAAYFVSQQNMQRNTGILCVLEETWRVHCCSVTCGYEITFLQYTIHSVRVIKNDENVRKDSVDKIHRNPT